MVLFELLQLVGFFLDYLRVEYLWHAPIMPLTNRNGIRSRGSRTHADEPFVGIGSCGEEGLGHLLVGGGGGPKAEAGDGPSRVNGSEQAKVYRYQPMLLDQPMSAFPASHPCPRRLQLRMGIAELSRAS